jgi:hypothetical protein
MSQPVPDEEALRTCAPVLIALPRAPGVGDRLTARLDGVSDGSAQVRGRVWMYSTSDR